MIPHSDRARRRPFLNDPGTATVTVVASGAQLEPPRSEAERARTASVNRKNLEIYARATSIDRALMISGARATTDGRCALSVKSRTPLGYLNSSGHSGAPHPVFTQDSSPVALID